MGNEAFKCGDFKQAEEYYTSALMQWDKVSLCNISRNYDTKKTQIMFQLQYQVSIKTCLCTKQAVATKDTDMLQRLNAWDHR